MKMNSQLGPSKLKWKQDLKHTFESSKEQGSEKLAKDRCKKVGHILCANISVTQLL